MLFDAGEPLQNPVLLQARLTALMSMLEAQNSAVERLRVERDAFRTERDTANAEVEKLQLIIKQLMRSRYGAHSEKLDPDQLQLGLEEVEQSLGAAQAGVDCEPPTDKKATGERKPPQRNRGALPAHLPRVEIVIDVEDKRCPCCGGAMHVIGEDVAEMLDVVPALYRVKVIRRPRYGCRGCEGAVVQAPAPERPLTGGMATEAVLAQVLVAKYSDHLPLYRQAQIFARHGIDLDRSTLANWVGRACWWLRPLAELLLGTILSSPKIFADDTPVPVLDPGRGRTKTGRLWSYARDDRPWQGPLPPAVAYVYSENRQGVHPRATSPSSPGCCRSTAMPGSIGCGDGRRARSSSPSAGRMSGASSSTSTMPPARRLPPRRCGGSPNSIRSRRASAAARPINAPASARPRADRWSRP